MIISSRDSKAYYRDDINPNKLKSKFALLGNKINNMIAMFMALEQAGQKIDDKVYGEVYDKLLASLTEITHAESLLSKYIDSLEKGEEKNFTTSLENPQIDPEEKLISRD